MRVRVREIKKGIFAGMDEELHGHSVNSLGPMETSKEIRPDLSITDGIRGIRYSKAGYIKRTARFRGNLLSRVLFVRPSETSIGTFR